MMLIGWIIDAVLLLMLLATLFIGNRINRRLSDVRAAQNELADLVAQLDQATNKAQACVTDLREAGGQAQTILSEEMARAKALADELSLIVEAGDNLATRLENRLSDVSREAKSRQDEAADIAPSKTGSAAEHETILAAIRDAR